MGKKVTTPFRLPAAKGESKCASIAFEASNGGNAETMEVFRRGFGCDAMRGALG